MLLVLALDDTVGTGGGQSVACAEFAWRWVLCDCVGWDLGLLGVEVCVCVCDLPFCFRASPTASSVSPASNPFLLLR